MRAFLILVLSCPLLAFAQSNPDSLKFEIIRATVNFLATDGKISKDAGFRVTCTFPNYICLESSIDETKLKGVLAKVRIWDYKKNGNSPEDVAKLKEKIWNDIIEPDAKSYRKKLPGFAEYSSKMTQLPGISKVSSPQNVSRSNADESIPAAPADSTRISTVSKDRTMEASQFPVFALIASIVAILMSLYAIFKSGKSPAQALPVHVPESNPREELNRELRNFKQEVIKITSELSKEMEANRRSVDNRIAELEANKNTLELALNNSSKPAQHPTPKDDAVISAPLLENLKYAKFLDVDHMGFSKEMLTGEQNGEQTFEIKISGNKAEYYVSSDTRAQKFALQNYEYLTEACEVRGHPQITSRVYTLANGSLSKSPEGNWMIDVKAFIEFK
jgi:hypothetical protein